MLIGDGAAVAQLKRPDGPPARRLRPLGRPRVLVCDDEPTIRMILQRALVAAGYDPELVSTGADVLEAVARESFDCLLLDVRLPEMDGPETLAKLRQTDPDLPVVIMSGYSGFDDAVDCLRRGAVDFVRKPFELDSLVRAVDGALATTHLKADSALLAATQMIFATMDPPEIARRVLHLVRRLLGAGHASLALAGPGGSTEPALRTYHLRQDGESVEVTDPPPPDAWRRLAEARDPVLLTKEVEADAKVLATVAPDAKELLSQRLCVGERVVAVMWCGRGEGSRGFGERDLRRLMLLAGHAALALENARLLQETERQARELERAVDRLVVAQRVATVARLSAGLGHEISNPACAVLAGIEVARSAIADGKGGEADVALGHATAGVNAILDVCQALHPLASQKTVRGELVDLKGVVDSAVMLATFALRGRARAVLEIPDDLPAFEGSASRLGQVFLNLLLNAAEAIEPGDEENRHVTVRAERAGAELVVHVADNGPGVAPELWPTLFEPSVTTKAASDGHGMGLAVCRWIVEDSGGAIACLPAPVGATFEIRLPLRHG